MKAKILVFLTFALVLFGRNSLADPPSITDFREKLPEVVSKILSSYSGTHCLVERILPSSDREYWEFESLEGRYLLKSEMNGKTTVLVVNPDHYFYVAKNTSESPFYLEEFDRSKGGIANAMERIRLNAELPLAPTSYIELPLVALLEDQLFAIDDIEAEGDSKFKIYWTLVRANKPEGKPYTGHFVFRRNPWLLEQVALGSESRKRFYDWTYEPSDVDEIPHVASGTCTIRELADGSWKLIRKEYDLERTNIDVNPVPEHFELQFYGIEEPNAPSNSRYLLLTLVGMGVVVVLLLRNLTGKKGS